MVLPATLVGAWSDNPNTHMGPFEYNGNLYAITLDFVAGSARIYKSTNAGDSWSEIATPIAFRNVLGNRLASAVLVGNTLYVAHSNSGASTSYSSVNLDTEVTSSVNTGPITATNLGNPSNEMSQLIAVRSNGNIVLAVGSSESIMGTQYGRVRIGLWNGSTWTTYEVSNGNTTLDTATQTHFSFRSIVQAGDRIHIFYTQHTSGAFTGLRHRTFESDNSFGTLTTIDSTPFGSAGDTTPYTCGFGVSYVDGAVTKIVQPYVDSNGALTVARCDTGSNPTFSFQAVSGTSTNDPEFTTASPGMCTVDGTTVYLFWPDDTTQDIYWSKSAAGAAWDSPLEWKDAVACNAVSINKITGAIGVLYDDGGTVKYDIMSLGGGPPPAVNPVWQHPRQYVRL